MLAEVKKLFSASLAAVIASRKRHLVYTPAMVVDTSIMARKGHAGWFVEVPVELKKEFERCFPGRAAKRKLTIAAIRKAIQLRAEINPPLEEKPKE